jgi:hypothetical protein
MALDIEQVDVADIVEDSMKVVGQAAAERDITLSRHGPSKLVVEADRRELKQVFLNLLSNAVKFTRDGGSVDVHLSRTRGLVRIGIKDTGIGIPEADIRKLGRPSSRSRTLLQGVQSELRSPSPGARRAAWRQPANQTAKAERGRHLHRCRSRPRPQWTRTRTKRLPPSRPSPAIRS